MRAISLGDVVHRTLRVLLGNRCFTKAGLAVGETTTKMQNANTVEYCIDGVSYSKAHTDDLFAFSTVTVQPISTTCYYVACLNAAGDGSIVNGTPVSTAAITAGTAAAVLPAIADTLVAVGVVKIVTSSGGTFTPGTSNVATAGAITATFFDLSCASSAVL